jgi:signal transduction histidine kinase/CheY-like chemotaxis protein
MSRRPPPGNLLAALRSRRSNTLALATVLLLIASFATASALIGRAKSADLAVTARIADAFGNARAASVTAHEFAERYRRAPSAETLAGFRRATADVVAGLDLATRLDPNSTADQAPVDRALALNAEYVAAAADLFAAIDAADRARADQLMLDAFGPAYDSLTATLNELQQSHHSEMAPHLANLERISTIFAVGTPVGLAGALVILLLVWRDRRRADELERSELAAAAADRTRSAVLATMSHELRTPLNAILGFSQLLLEGSDLGERQRVYLQNVHQAGQRLLHVVNDVLAITNVDSGTAQLRLEVTSLSSMLEPVVAYGQERATDRGLTFEVKVQRDAHVIADVASVRLLLTNLLSNAVKFTEAGRVTLGVTVEEAALVLEVTDSGVGIRQEDFERVFTPFDRPLPGGAIAAGPGLGLALVKRLVELQGGTINLESVVGGGTTVRVRLPSVVIVAKDGARLLIVDDEQGDAGLVSALAWEQGLFVEVATTVARALAAIARELPLGVVLDLRLPDGRGERVLAALRAQPMRIPVVVVTVEDPGTPRLDVDDFITKPLDTPRLRAWLARAARTSRGVHANPAR